MAKKILVTSALPYVNNIPHLGNLVCVIGADVYTRFLRSMGHEVLSVLGTDEHGSTTEIKAWQEGKSAQEIVDHYAKIHFDIYKWFNTDFDCLGRTTDEQTHELTKEIFTDLDNNGLITQHTQKQLWDEKAQRFLPDRFVVGTCPHCGYDKARGDQCENCNTLLDPEQLIDVKSVLTDTTPVIKDSTHLYLDLPKMQETLRVFYEDNKEKWTKNAVTTTKAWLDKGLLERGITRDLKFGVHVPKQGFEDKVFYSWFDAPIGYIGITKKCRDDWQSWWQNEAVDLVQFMGKDNIPFHTILFPAYLMGTKKDWTLLKKLFVNEYLNYEGGKFSKSQHRGIFGDNAKESDIEADIYRYYIASVYPETQDTEFNWDDFAARYNNELLANIGNLVHRTSTFIEKFFEGNITVSQPDAQQEMYDALAAKYEDAKYKDVVQRILQMSTHWNTYFQDNKPWELVKTDKDKCQEVLSTLVHGIRDVAVCLAPIMPKVTQRIQTQLQLPELSWSTLGSQLHQIQLAEVKPLFSKIEDTQIAALKEKFGQEEKVDTWSLLDLRVGKVLSVEQHPEKKHLFIEQIDLGDEKRQILSGLNGIYTPEELVGKNVIVVSNLPPVEFHGYESQGMLLVALHKKKGEGVLMAPNSQPGERVRGNEHRDTKSEITIDEFKQLKIRAKDGKVVLDGEVLQTDTEELCVDKEIMNGKVC